MIRWLLPLAPCLLWACIEDVPATPEGCDPTACGQAPDVSQVQCEDNAGPVVRCEAQANGACGWTIEPCDPPFEPFPEPIVDCTPELCGPQPDGAACPNGEAPRMMCDAIDGVCGWTTEPCDPPPTPVECTPELCGPAPYVEGCSSLLSMLQMTCERTGDDCAWQVDCVPSCCMGEIPSGAPCGPGRESTLECINCEWVRGCGPLDCSRPEACGPIPQGEPCADDEIAVTECRALGESCEWYSACETPCDPGACGEQPIPNCPYYTAECLPGAEGCAWQVECDYRCARPFDPGSCDGLEEVWWYNLASGACEVRTYGGCEGNSNRFASEAACLEACLLPDE